ncbi:MAG: CMP-binding protein [Candidatus Schekmanbacteria bacterium RBG_13_48_7]|uniref:CMP-binding protein n=1 Tax=Candidatus Schekmanbacteria bacterium RBG_13_48_7 TaxID=1817878 RepID=A0A1F7RY91_9BACT|nr:MAG: CMP-binding protein [Candidatus Schekmanbacteria bacterium RBG_13_48_7]
MLKVNTRFIDVMVLAGEFNAYPCINCGTCTALCPMEIGLLPRQLFRYVHLGIEKKVIENTETIFSCLLCKMCEDNCPAKVQIVENIRILRAHINRTVYKL